MPRSGLGSIHLFVGELDDLRSLLGFLPESCLPKSEERPGVPNRLVPPYHYPRSSLEVHSALFLNKAFEVHLVGVTGIDIAGRIIGFLEENASYGQTATKGVG